MSVSPAASPVVRSPIQPAPPPKRSSSQKTVAPVAHGTGCADCLGTEFVTANAPKTAKAAATAPAPTPEAAAKVSAWVKGTFKEMLERAPTAAELGACTKAIHGMLAEGKHVFVAGAAIVNLIKAGEEYKKKHPLSEFFDRAYQTHVGRTPSMAELKKGEAYLTDVTKKGTNFFEALNHIKFFLKVGEEGKAYAAAHPAAEWVQNAFFDNIGRAATGEELAGSEEIFGKAGHPWAAGAFITALLRQKPEFAQKFPLGPWLNETYNKELGRMPSVEELTKGSEFIDGLMKQGKHVFEAGAAFTYVLRLGEEWQTRHAKGAEEAPLSSGNLAYPLAVRGTINGRPYQGTHTIGNWQSDNAIDLNVPVGTPVYAVADGVIGPNIGPLDSSNPRFAGQRLTVNASGNAFYYAHLSELTVRAGQHVKKGQLIGYSGSANGVPHLHLGVQHGNPAQMFGW